MENGKTTEAIQILEDAYSTSEASVGVADELRRLHYAWAQYEDPTTGDKPTPEVRIEHLRRILALGFNFDYIHKMLAEAYHDLGDDTQARVYLTQAFELNPQVSGVVRISRALGILPQHKKSQKHQATPSYRYSRQEQIPTAAQIRALVQQKNWISVIAFGNPADYAPPIRGKERFREMLREVARSLGEYKDDQSIATLTRLLEDPFTWDVSEAAITSLSKIGNKESLNLLKKFRAQNGRVQASLRASISYLEARIRSEASITTQVSARGMLAQAKTSFANENYGAARFILENVLTNLESDRSIYFDATILLARSCAEMGDTRSAVGYIKGVLPQLPHRDWLEAAGELASWLWAGLVFEEYSSRNDEDYQLALSLHLELLLTFETADDVLQHLNWFTNWLDLLGVNETAQWIKRLVRTEAPGTWIADKYRRDQNTDLRNVELSQKLKDQIVQLDERVKASIPSKLTQVLKTRPSSIGSSSTRRNLKISEHHQ